MPGSWSINAEKSAKLKELFESINIGGAVRFNTGYRGGLEWEGIRKLIPGDDWVTRLFQTHSVEYKTFLKKQFFLNSFPRRVTF